MGADGLRLLSKSSRSWPTTFDSLVRGGRLIPATIQQPYRVTFTYRPPIATGEGPGWALQVVEPDARGPNGESQYEGRHTPDQIREDLLAGLAQVVELCPAVG